jgi:hypothetical protein
MPTLRPAPQAPTRRRRLPRPYLEDHALPSDHSPEPAPRAPLPLLHRVLAGLRALPDTPRLTPPVAGWKCMVHGCLWESINPMDHPCPFPPPSAKWCTATLAELNRRLLARDPSLGAPPEQREPSPYVITTQELPIITDAPATAALGRR